jgi:hypothetical protein
MSLELDSSARYIATCIFIKRLVRFSLSEVYAFLYGAPNAVTVESAAMLVAESFSVYIATVPVFAITTIIHYVDS